MYTSALKVFPKNTLVRSHTYTYEPGTLESLGPGRKIIIYMFKPWKYRSKCKLCMAVDHGKKFHKYFITTPICLYCGSLEHKLIKPQTDPENINLITTQYSCPCLQHEEWPKLGEQLNNGYLKVQSCPKKFALAHGYQKSDINEAILCLAASDYGFMMGRRGLHEFYTEVIELCENEQQSFAFKRANMIEDESVDEFESLTHPASSL